MTPHHTGFTLVGPVFGSRARRPRKSQRRIFHAAEGPCINSGLGFWILGSFPHSPRSDPRGITGLFPPRVDCYRVAIVIVHVHVSD